MELQVLGPRDIETQPAPDIGILRVMLLRPGILRLDGPELRLVELAKHRLKRNRMDASLRSRGVPPHWLGYVNVDNVDETANKVRSLGGKVVKVEDIPDIGRYAVIGLSRPRRGQAFAGLALDGRLSEKDAVARCGIVIVDIDSGNAVEWLRFEHTIDELYDVAALPRVRAAEAIGFKSDDIRREITVE